MKSFQKTFIYTFLLLLVSGNDIAAQSKLNVELIAHWDSDTIIQGTNKSKFSDVWGYEKDGREYALICSTEGVHFFEIENNQFRFVDFVQGTYASAIVTNRDVTTYKHYAYTGCDHGTSNLQIIDMSYLPDSVVVVAEIDQQFGRLHNLFVDEENALLYACRVTPIVNGNVTTVVPMRVFSLADPVNPQLLYEGPNGISEVHDIWVQDEIAVLNCGFDGMRVYDFSNPSSPLYIQNIPIYQDQGYNHQGAMTPDGTKYVFGDETNGKLLKLYTVGNDHKLTVKNYFGTNAQNSSIPHNIMCSNEFAFVAYYNEGLRIYDIRTSPKEIAHFDTYPDDSDFKMNGAWGVYSQLPSKRILISDIQYGLFLFDFDRELFQTKVEELSVYPTLFTSGEEITIQLKQGSATAFSVKVFDTTGKIIVQEEIINQTYAKLTPQLNQGMYFVEVTYIDYLKEEIKTRVKVLVY
jgi:choice-of-anchor B domain-containing protein